MLSAAQQQGLFTRSAWLPAHVRHLLCFQQLVSLLQQQLVGQVSQVLVGCLGTAHVSAQQQLLLLLLLLLLPAWGLSREQVAAHVQALHPAL
jgi:hypothetical protein